MILICNLVGLYNYIYMIRYVRISLAAVRSCFHGLVRK